MLKYFILTIKLTYTPMTLFSKTFNKTLLSAFSPTHFHQNWLTHPRTDILSGLAVALALIPEAIAFSIIAGVAPQVGLYASFCIAVVSAFFGGRPAMISAATGAMALVLASLVKHHGIEYMLAATLLTGLLQILAGAFGLGGICVCSHRLWAIWHNS